MADVRVACGDPDEGDHQMAGDRRTGPWTRVGAALTWLRSLDAASLFVLAGAAASSVVFTVVALFLSEVLTPTGVPVLLGVAVLALPLAVFAMHHRSRHGEPPRWWGWVVTVEIFAAGHGLTDPSIRQHAAIAMIIGPVYVAMFTARLTPVLTLFGLSGLGTVLLAISGGADAGTEVARGLTALTVSSLLFSGMLLLLRRLRSAQDVAEHASRHDPLTGLLNRRGLDHHLPATLDRAAREGRVLFVAIADLDHFKRINDAHGHAAGDDVLTAVAEQIRARSRAEDLSVRIGGEELLLVGATEPDAVAALAELVRQTVAGTPCEPPVTASIGVAFDLVATSWAGRGATARTETASAVFRDLYRRADELLYVAKTSGRNRVVAEPTPEIIAATVRPGIPAAPRPTKNARPA